MSRSRFTREFKISAVKLVNEQGYSVPEAAKGLRVDSGSIRGWTKLFSTGADTAALSATGTTVARGSYTFSSSNVEFKYLFGDTADAATFSDSTGNDQFYQLPSYSLMLDGVLSYYNQTIGFGSSTANATTGTYLLLVYGTGGNDTYAASTTASGLTSAGLSLVGNGSDQVFAFGS